MVFSDECHSKFSDNLPIAIEVSGDGVLPLTATLAGSTSPTALESLNVFLSSIPFGQNITVSPPGILEQEPGSTVKHLNFQIGNFSCLEQGTYNVRPQCFDFNAVIIP